MHYDFYKYELINYKIYNKNDSS